MKILTEGQLCRHCHTQVVRRTHKKPPKYKEGGYYFEYWLCCRNCETIYMVESAKRFFPPPEMPLLDFCNKIADEQQLTSG
jgi:hypothetical protein